MLDYKELKTNLNSRLSESSIIKNNKNKKINTCEHDYKKYRQTITERSEKNSFKGNAYFVVLLCDKCKDKKYIGYKVE